MSQQWLMWPNRLRFRSLGRPPVRGGRWSVRKKPLNPGHTHGPFIYNVSRRGFKPGEGEKVWKAWVRQGKAKKWSASFHTYGEAIRWATYVAYMFKMGAEKSLSWSDRQALEHIYQSRRYFEKHPLLQAIAQTKGDWMLDFINYKFEEAKRLDKVNSRA